MRKCFVIGSMVAALGALVTSASADNRISVSKKGSLLIYSKVEIKWTLEEEPGEDPEWEISQDTFLDLSNDYPQDVNVQFYFVNGDPPLDEVCEPVCEFIYGDLCHSFPECIAERAHPGWNWVDCEIPLTANQPTYFSAFTGFPAGCQPFTELDPGDPPGRPNPDDPRGLTRVLRGFVIAFAVKNDVNNGQNVQIRWNHLKGDAILVDYIRATAAEYNTYNAAVVEVPGGPGNGDFVGTAGVINLDGMEYDIAFERLVFDFYASSPRGAFFDTDITLHPVSADLRQETEGPPKTKAVFAIWNEDEVRFSGTEKCIECWDQTLASNYPAPNHFTIDVLGTVKGKARVEGIASNIAACPLAERHALLGLQIKQAAFGTPFGLGFTCSALTMVGQGERAATILYDIIPGSDEAQGLAAAGLGGAGMKGRAGR